MSSISSSLALAVLAAGAFTSPAPAAQHEARSSSGNGSVLSLDAYAASLPAGGPIDVLVTIDGPQGLALHHFRSPDDGATWQGPHVVDTGAHRIMPPRRSIDHQVASRGDLVLAAFTEHDEATRFGAGALRISRSLDGGVSWRTLPSPSDQPSGGHNFADLAFDSTGALYAVWLDGRDGGQGLRVAVSRDRGESWSTNQTLDDRTCECCWNAIVVDPADRVHVLYRDKDPRDMALVSTLDHGASWQRLGRVGEFDWDIDGCPHVGGGLAVTLGPGGAAPRLHAVVWTGREGTEGLYSLASSDSGETWSAPVRVGGERARRGDLTSIGGTLYAAWDERVGDDWVVFGASSRDGGLSWEAAQRLSGQDAEGAALPKIVANGRVALAVFTESVGEIARWSARRVDALWLDSPATANGESQEVIRPSVEARYREQITVTEREEPSLTMPSTAAVQAELAEVPGGTGVVTAEEYRVRRVSTIEDALGLEPGVIAQSRFGAEEARLSIRGSGIQRTFHGRGLALLQDGVPLNLADGGFDFQAVEPLAARHVEVLRGANALRYGSSTLGGAINYRSYTGHDADRWTARLEGGEFGYLRASGALGGVRDTSDYFASLSHFGQDGFREHAEQGTQRLFSNFGWRPSDSTETRVYATAVRTDSELPGSLTRAQLEADPSQASAGNIALDQKRDFDLARLSSRTAWQTSSRDSLELAGFWSWKHLDHPIFQVIDQKSDDFGVEARWLGDRELAGTRHRFVVGLRPSYGVVDDARFANVAGGRGAPTALARTRSENLELYAEDRIEASERVVVVAGLQLAHAGRELEDHFLANGDNSDDPDFSAASPKLGIFFQASPELALFANVSRSFEPPSFGELVFFSDGLIDLEPQTATSFEAGMRGGDRTVRYDIVAYHAELDDELLSLTDENGNPLGTINAETTTHSGIELGLDLGFELGGDSRLELDAAYTWGRFRFDGDPAFGDNQIAGLPEHLVRAQLRWLFGGLYLGPKVDWAPDDWAVDHANTLFAGAYAVYGFEAGFRSEGGFTVFVDARNLSDEIYAATTGVLATAGGRDLPQFLPGDGRSIYVGFEVRAGRR